MLVSPITISCISDRLIVMLCRSTVYGAKEMIRWKIDIGDITGLARRVFIEVAMYLRHICTCKMRSERWNMTPPWLRGNHTRKTSSSVDSFAAIKTEDGLGRLKA